MVPITVAAVTAALAATAVALILSLTGVPRDSQTLVMALVLVAGLGVFALAMWWDRSDRVRQTRRSDVAFWLHLLAAPMIAHPIFFLLGVTQGDDISRVAAVMVIGIYIAFGLVARSEEHTSELQSLMRISYAVFCL